MEVSSLVASLIPFLSQAGVFNNAPRGAVFILCCRLTRASAIKAQAIPEGSPNYGFQVEKGKTVSPSHIPTHHHHPTAPPTP